MVAVGAGEVRSHLVFRVPKQQAYTVRGFVSADDKSGLGEDRVTVVLAGLDGRFWGSETIDFRGSFPLPNMKYFSFGNIFPGRYMAYAVVSGQGWYTKVVEVNVTTHAKLIFLELKHGKGSAHGKAPPG